MDLEILKEQELYLMCVSTSEQRLICATNNNLQSEGLESKNKMFFFWNWQLAKPRSDNFLKINVFIFSCCFPPLFFDQYLLKTQRAQDSSVWSTAQHWRGTDTASEHPGPVTFLCFTAIYKWIFKNKQTHLFILEG